jgi:GNAT superfamily N-acetyltransferase
LTSYRRPCLLDPDLHDRADFVCREAAYAQWLYRYAGQNRRGNTAATWVITDAAHHVVAYATLSMTGIDLSRAPAALGRHAPDPVPALLIGRLAVDERHEGQGLGTELVKHILATAIELNESVALKAVVVTALNDSARTWWRDRLGFTPFDPNDEDNYDLYLLTTVIAATIESL